MARYFYMIILNTSLLYIYADFTEYKPKRKDRPISDSNH
jgi:hypothetical protein